MDNVITSVVTRSLNGHTNSTIRNQDGRTLHFLSFHLQLTHSSAEELRKDLYFYVFDKNYHYMSGSDCMPSEHNPIGEQYGFRSG